MSFFAVYVGCDSLRAMQMYPKQDESIAWEAGDNYTHDHKCGVVVGKDAFNVPSEKIEEYVRVYLPQTTDDAIPKKMEYELIEGLCSLKIVTTDERTFFDFLIDPWQVADYQDLYSFEKLTVTLLEDDE